MMRRLVSLGAAAVALSACVTPIPQSSRPVLTVAPVAVDAEGVTSELGARMRGALVDNLVRCEQFIVLDDPLATWRPPSAAQMSSRELADAARQAAGSPLQPPFEVEVAVVSYGNHPADRRPGSSGDPEAHVGLEMRVTNLDTGQPVTGEPITVRERLHDNEGLRDTAPLNRAANRAVHEVVESLMRDLPPFDWTPTVARVEGNAIVLNGGQDRGIQVGDRFQVFRTCDPYYNANTGQLGGVNLSESMGIISVVEVHPTTSLLTFPEGWPVEAGMVLRPVEVESRPWWRRLLNR